MKRPAEALNAACGRMTTTSSGSAATPATIAFARFVVLRVRFCAMPASCFEEAPSVCLPVGQFLNRRNPWLLLLFGLSSGAYGDSPPSGQFLPWFCVGGFDSFHLAERRRELVRASHVGDGDRRRCRLAGRGSRSWSAEHLGAVLGEELLDLVLRERAVLGTFAARPLGAAGRCQLNNDVGGHDATPR